MTKTDMSSAIASATTGMQQMQTAMQDMTQKATKSAENVAAFSQGYFEAITQSGQILTTGLQEIGQTVAASAKASMEEAAATMKTLSGVKSIKEALEIQSALVRSCMEKATSSFHQLTDSTLKLFEQAAAPITARITAATETFSCVG